MIYKTNSISRMPKDVPFTAKFLAVKLLDIGLTTVYFFTFGIAAAKCFDLIYGKMGEDDYQKYSLVYLFFDIILHLFMLGVTAYMLRNFIELIPFPFNGVAGYDHFRLKELEGGEVMALVLILFQKDLQEKVKVFVNRVAGLTMKDGEGNVGLKKGRK